MGNLRVFISIKHTAENKIQQLWVDGDSASARGSWKCARGWLFCAAQKGWGSRTKAEGYCLGRWGLYHDFRECQSLSSVPPTYGIRVNAKQPYCFTLFVPLPGRNEGRANLGRQLMGNMPSQGKWRANHLISYIFAEATRGCRLQSTNQNPWFPPQDHVGGPLASSPALCPWPGPGGVAHVP